LPSSSTSSYRRTNDEEGDDIGNAPSLAPHQDELDERARRRGSRPQAYFPPRKTACRYEGQGTRRERNGKAKLGFTTGAMGLAVYRRPRAGSTTRLPRTRKDKGLAPPSLPPLRTSRHAGPDVLDGPPGSPTDAARDVPGVQRSPRAARSHLG
jgi:hypothetical protein